jgi:hypothetical protein
MTEIDNAQASREEWIGATVLWAVTSALAFVLITTILDIALTIYAVFWGEYGFYGQSYQIGTAIRQFLVLPLGLLAVGIIIGGAEYHYRHIGEPASWKLFAETLAVELTLFLIAAFI